MVNIVLNERTFVENALENLELGPNMFETLSRIARYYYEEGYKKREIGCLIEDFLYKCDPDINIVKWQNLIDKVVRSADKYPLREISGVDITEKELEKIKQIEGGRLQRLMFTMLCLAKFGNAVSENNNGWVNRKDKDIFSLANVAVSTKEQSLMLNRLRNEGYIGFSKVVDNVNINVKIIDNENEPVITVGDFRNLGNRYRMICGERYMECECCGAVVRQTTNNQKYCRACSVETHRKRVLGYYYESIIECDNT